MFPWMGPLIVASQVCTLRCSNSFLPYTPVQKPPPRTVPKSDLVHSSITPERPLNRARVAFVKRFRRRPQTWPRGQNGRTDTFTMTAPPHVPILGQSLDFANQPGLRVDGSPELPHSLSQYVGSRSTTKADGVSLSLGLTVDQETIEQWLKGAFYPSMPTFLPSPRPI